MGHAPFPAEFRLRQSSDYRAAFANGKRCVRCGLVVIAAPGQEEFARLGLALAKKRIPRAVDRNRVKRVIRESFRCNRDQLGGVDIVVLARNGTSRMPNRRLFGELRGIWNEVAAAFGSAIAACDQTAGHEYNTR